MAGKQVIVTKKEKQGTRTAKTGSKANKPSEESVRKPPPHPSAASAPAAASAYTPCSVWACARCAAPTHAGSSPTQAAKNIKSKKNGLVH